VKGGDEAGEDRRELGVDLEVTGGDRRAHRADRRTRKTCGSSNGRDAAVAKRPGFCHGPGPQETLVEEGPENSTFLAMTSICGDGERLLLSIEHRAAASSSGLEIELADRGGGLTLHVRDDIGAPTADRPRSPAERVLEALADATAPLTRRELRDTCRLCNAPFATPSPRSRPMAGSASTPRPRSAVHQEACS
jgi:hypothetical protein